MFEIVYLLLERPALTASELAERFEVSVRTIYRDIDALSASGIPVYAQRGKGGGIRLLEGFTLSKSLLSAREQSDVISALQALEATGGSSERTALSKLGALFQQSLPRWVDIDFTDWGNFGREQFEDMRRAILERRLLSFVYTSSYGEKAERTVEPVRLWFKHRGWYLVAYDLDKQAPRTFRLSRMRNVAVSEKTFVPRPEDAREHRPPDMRGATLVTVRLKIDASQLYRIYDEFDDRRVTREGDGFVCEATYPEDEWVYGFILSFGHYAEVLEPPHIRDILAQRLAKTLSFYKT